MKVKRLAVGTPQGAAGELLRESQYVFNYTSTERACEVSLTMPLRAQSYVGNQLPPVFGMNLPEGFLQQRIVERLAKYEAVDDMRLLAITGAHPIGRLQYAVPGEPRSARKPEIGLQRLLGEPATNEMFEHLVDIYFDSGISGVQPKVMLPDADKPLSERATLLQSDLIVKAGGDEYPHLAANEFLCMDAACRAGITVPHFWLSDDGRLFVMERFDLHDGDRLGFEDMAVLMDKAREPTGHYKYTESYEAIARFIAALCRENATESLQRFYEYLVLCIAVRNGDAHLKNFGLLYTHPHAEAPRLAPLYDVVTTAAYDDIDPRTGKLVTDRTLALKLDKSRSYPARERLLAFGRELCHVRSPERVIERVGTAMSETLDAHRERVDRVFFQRIREEWDGGRAAIARPKLHAAGRKSGA
ncbi:MAG: type II toxin-antitoxin system HipA family toxin [Rhodanobacteraceae bacterium]